MGQGNNNDRRKKKKTILSDYFLKKKGMGQFTSITGKLDLKQKQHINNHAQLNTSVRTSFDSQAKMPLNHCNGVDRTWKIWYSDVMNQTMEVVPNC